MNIFILKKQEGIETYIVAERVCLKTLRTLNLGYTLWVVSFQHETLGQKSSDINAQIEKFKVGRDPELTWSWPNMMYRDPWPM
jgi:hypothetical protein